jgi:hypothetical protein
VDFQHRLRAFLGTALFVAIMEEEKSKKGVVGIFLLLPAGREKGDVLLSIFQKYFPCI